MMVLNRLNKVWGFRTLAVVEMLLVILQLDVSALDVDVDARSLS